MPRSRECRAGLLLHLMMIVLQRRHFCYHLGDWGRQTPPPLRRFEAFTVTLIDAIWNKWTDWLAALGSAAAGLEQVGLTFASPEPRDIGGAMVFAKLHTLKLDVVVYVPCEVWVSLWHRTPWEPPRYLNDAAVQMSLRILNETHL